MMPVNRACRNPHFRIERGRDAGAKRGNGGLPEGKNSAATRRFVNQWLCAINNCDLWQRFARHTTSAHWRVSFRKRPL